MAKINRKKMINKHLIKVPDPTPDNPPQGNGQVKYPDGKPYYFYVLYCADGTLYGGFTDDVQKRFAKHQAGKGAKYTRPQSRHPLQLAYSQKFTTKHDALSAEYHFKHQERTKKLRFLQDHGVEINKLKGKLSRLRH